MVKTKRRRGFLFERMKQKLTRKKDDRESYIFVPKIKIKLIDINGYNINR